MKQEKLVVFFFITRLLFVACCIFLVFAHYSHGFEKLESRSYHPFIMAAFSSRFEKMKQMYEREAININMKGFDGTTALHNVCKNGGFPGGIEALRYLIDHGADVRGDDALDQEPIHYTIQIVDIDKRDMFIEELVKSGADIRAVTGMVEPLVAKKENARSFSLAELVVSNFDFAGIRNLISVWGQLLGEQLIKRASDYARDIGLREMADLMNEVIHKGNDIDYKKNRFRGMSRLMLAILRADVDLVGQLIKKPSSLVKVSRDRYRQAPLHLAIRHGNIEVVKKLLDAGANLQAKDYLGNDALHIVARHGNESFRISCLELLVSRGASLSEKNNEGDTPLHIAMVLGHDDLVSYVVRSYPNKVDLGIRNKKGLRVKDIAKKYQYAAILELLKG